MSEQPTQDLIGTPQPITPGLYLVATPIGNLRDITLRALDVLAGADEIYCEDTRVSGKLLQAYAIKTKLSVYNDHSKESVRQKIIDKINDGKAIALVSDAGMPLISDPGYKLVRDCLDAGVKVTSLPGANAVLTALQLSGMPTDSFSFHGFLPAKSTARQKYLEQCLEVHSTHIFYESGKRLLAALKDMHSALGACEVAVTRELTKKFEEIKTGKAEELISLYEEKGAPKGEIVIVMSPPQKTEITAADLDALIIEALSGSSVKEVAAQIAKETGKPKKEIYERALALKS